MSFGLRVIFDNNDAHSTVSPSHSSPMTLFKARRLSLTSCSTSILQLLVRKDYKPTLKTVIILASSLGLASVTSARSPLGHPSLHRVISSSSLFMTIFQILVYKGDFIRRPLYVTLSLPWAICAVSWDLNLSTCLLSSPHLQLQSMVLPS